MKRLPSISQAILLFLIGAVVAIATAVSVVHLAHAGRDLRCGMTAHLHDEGR